MLSLYCLSGGRRRGSSKCLMAETICSFLFLISNTAQTSPVPVNEERPVLFTETRPSLAG
jgi:hypothetical protein